MKNNLKSDATQIIIRKVITAFSGYLIGRGIFTEQDLNPQLIELFAGLIGIGITTILSKKHYAKVKKSSNN